MEIIKSRYGIERTVEKLDVNRIRVMGESLITRGSEDDAGNQTMFDFEGGPCLNVGGTIKYLGTDFKILSIKSEKTKIENVSSVVLEVLY